MSDALIASLNARITALEESKRKLGNALRNEREGRRDEVRELRAALEAKGAELDELVGQVETELAAWDEEKADLAAQLDEARGNPDERVAKLEAELRTRDVRDKFRGVEKELSEGWTLDDLFTLNKFDPASVEAPGEFDPAETVKGWREARPGVFRTPGGVTPPTPPRDGAPHGPRRPPLVVDDAASRGARGTASGSVRYTRSEVQQPNWMNSPRGRAILEARQNGTAELVDSP